MEAPLHLWQDAGKIDVRNRAPESYQGGEEEEEEEDDDSLFELVINAPPESDKIVVDSVKNDVVMSEQISPLKLKSNCKSAQSPISLLKSAPRFRVLFLGFRKQKPAEKIPLLSGSEAIPVAQKHQLHKSPDNIQSKRFALDFEVEEVRIASLFSRDNSLRSKLQREHASDFPSNGDVSRKSPKDFPKYLNLIKPFYVRASKRYTESSRLSSTDSPWSSPATMAASNSPRKLSEEKRGNNNRAAGFKALSKHLGKSRSASSTAPMTPSLTSRRDDSLLLQNDGIQSAILHCKRSLYSTSSQECSALWRSASDPATGKPVIPASNSSGAQMRCTSI